MLRPQQLIALANIIARNRPREIQDPNRDNDNGAPSVPPCVTCLCCLHLGPPPDFVELPDRSMIWAPTHLMDGGGDGGANGCAIGAADA